MRRSSGVGSGAGQLAALLVLAWSVGCTPFQVKPRDDWITQPSQGKALVCILFPKGGGWGGSFAQVFIEEGDDDRYLATLFPGTHVMLELEPGEYLFELVGETLDLMRATVKTGETYHAAIGTYVAPIANPFRSNRGHFTFKPINDPYDEKLPVWISRSEEIEPTPEGEKQGAKAKKRLQEWKPRYQPKWEAKQEPQHLSVPTPHTAAVAGG